MRARQLLWIAGLGALAAFATTQLKLTHSITHFMPSGEQGGMEAELVSLSTEIASSQLTRTALLSISLEGAPAGREDLLVDASSRFARRLERLPGVLRVSSGLAEDQLDAIYEIYFPRRLYLVSETPEEEVPALLTRDALEASAAALRERLSGPASAGVSRLASADPLSLFERFTARLRADDTDLDLRGGHFLTRDGRFALVFLESRSSPFDSEQEGPLQAGIARAFQDVADEIGEPLVLEQAGVGRLALATETSIRRDLRRIGTLSVLGVCSLFLLFFRSPRNLVLALVPALAGVAFACSLGVLFAGRLHGITLAFGASLVGIAVDYSIHLINHHSLVPESGGVSAVVRRLRPSLLLGAGTTIAGFAGFALTSFPGVREMGLFAMTGIAGALLVTLFGLPVFLRDVEPSTASQRGAARALGAWVQALRARRRILWALPSAALLVTAAGAGRVTWYDDPALLTQQDPALLAEDARVRSRASRIESGRFVVAVAVADDAETALARNDEVWRRLQVPIAAGDLDGVQSLHDFVWSESLQRRNLAAFQSVAALGARVDAAFTAQGFQPGAFSAFARAVASPEAEPLRVEDLADTPLARAIGSMWIDLDGRLAAITYLRGVHDVGAVADAVAGLPDAHFFDQRPLLENLYASYRRKAGELIAAGCVFVFGLLWLRYRSWRLTLAAGAPSVLVMGAVLGLYGLIGSPMNLIGMASLILILGIAVDYGIFLVDSAKEPDHLGATMLSLLASCLTTLFVFGTLALSSQPALRAIGMTTGMGVLLGFGIAPAALLGVGGDAASSAASGASPGDGEDSTRRVG